jgi:hypothetical protein
MKLASIAALLIAAHGSLLPVHAQIRDSVSPNFHLLRASRLTDNGNARAEI